MYGESGNDTYYIYIEDNRKTYGRNRKTYIFDTLGTNEIEFYVISNLKFVFNVDRLGILDSNGFRIISNDDYNKWLTDCSDESINGISIIEGLDTFKVKYDDGARGKVYEASINQIKSNVVNWLSGTQYQDVQAVLSSNNETDINNLLNNFNVTWSNIL